MQRGMKESYDRTWDLLKDNKSSLLIMVVLLLIFIFGMNMSAQVLTLIIYGFIGLAVGALVGGIYLIGLGGGLMVLGIILVVIGALLILAMATLFFILIAIIGAVGMGVQIHIAELLLRLKAGIKPTWNGIIDEVKGDWKHLLKRGFDLFIRYLLLSFVITIIFDLVFFGAIGGSIALILINSTSETSITLATLLVLIVSSIFGLATVFLMPLIMFVMDSSCVRVAEGKGAGTAIRHGLKDVRYNHRGIMYYFVGVLAIILLSMIVFPIAFLVQPLLPILTKSFIIMNRDMFYE